MYIECKMQIFKTQLDYQNHTEDKISHGVLISHFYFLWNPCCIFTLSAFLCLANL